MENQLENPRSVKKTKSEAYSVEVMAAYGEERPENALERQQGEDLPPRVHGYLPYALVNRTRHLDFFLKELPMRGVDDWGQDDGI